MPKRYCVCGNRSVEYDLGYPNICVACFFLIKKEHWDTFTLKILEQKGDKVFALHWDDGKTEYVVGKDIASAFKNAGYGGGAINVLDYYEPVDLAFLEKHSKHVPEIRKRINKAIEKSEKVTSKLIEKLSKFL